MSVLVPVLLILTAVSGCVDAVSFLGLGQVFVANMTGNVVFLGFVAAGSTLIDPISVVTSLTSFLIAAFAAGRWLIRPDLPPRLMIRDFVRLQIVLFGVAAVLVVSLPGFTVNGGRYAVIALLAFGMGLQVAGVQRLPAAGATRTTVVTTTLTSLVAPSLAPGTSPTPAIRLVLSVISLAVGAAVSAILLLHVGMVVSLVLAIALLAVALGSLHLATPEPPSSNSRS
jgi:uncharacterized membrane protein YoaK (UPF0700 family)